MSVDDLAEAAVFLMQNYDEPRPINVGVGQDISIRALAELIKEIVGYDGDLHFDRTKPDGTPRKLLDVSRIANLGWHAHVELPDGLRRTYAWYQERFG